MHRPPRRNILSHANIRKQVRQLSFRHTTEAERPPPPAGTVQLGATPVIYRVIATGGRYSNVTLLKDISFDDNKLAPRVLILTRNTPCMKQDGMPCTLEHLDLDIFDEVYVSAVTPWWSESQGWVWKGADEPCTIPTKHVAPHAAACSATFKNLCARKRTLSYIKALLPNTADTRLRFTIVDPMNEETRLPIYVTHAALPLTTYISAHKAIYIPAENMHWFRGVNELKRMTRGFYRLKWIEPVELAVSIPVAEIERLSAPYRFEPFDVDNAIKDHEEALASSVTLAMAHQQGIAQKETLRLVNALWREESGKLFGQFYTTLPGQANRRKLASYARHYPAEANLRLRRLEKKGNPLAPTSEQEYDVRGSTDCTVSDTYVDEDGNFELEIVMDNAYAALRELLVTNVDEMRHHLFEVKPRVTPLVPRGITQRFREGELAKTIASDGLLPDGKRSDKLAEKVETLKAFLGGGVYDHDRDPTERQIKLVNESDFNVQQKNAVLAFFDGHRQGIVRAGAGTGKTTVISGAVQVMCDRANALEDQLVQDNNRIVRQNFGVEEYDPETWLHEPRLPEVRPWVIAAPSNAAVGNGIQACVDRCGKQFKFIALMSATALKKIYGGTTPWQKNLAPSLINDMAADGERWGLSKHEYELFARAIDICSKRYSCLSGVNWTQLVNEKETDENDATVMRLVLQAVIRRYRPQVIFGTVSTVIRSMDTLSPFELFCIDEASTCPEIATLSMLLSADSPRKSMLVGDTVQLGVHEANLHSRNKKIGFRSALDAVLDRKYATDGLTNMTVVELTESHRFEKQVGEFVSRAFYEGRMTTSPNKPRHGKLLRSNFPLPRKGVPMVAVDIGGEESRNVLMSYSVTAHTEAVINLATALKVFVPSASIGVVCFYNGQIEALLDDGVPIPKHDVHSVDTSHGLEYDIVIIVPARTDVNEERDADFLGSKKRQCVSFSRARCGFILVGALKQLYKVETWKEVLDILYQYTDPVGPEYIDVVNSMVENVLEDQAAARNIEQPSYPAIEVGEDEIQILDDESPDVRRIREAFRIPENDPHFSPSMARGIDIENLDRHSDSYAQSQGDVDVDNVEQTERPPTTPDLPVESHQPQDTAQNQGDANTDAVEQNAQPSATPALSGEPQQLQHIAQSQDDAVMDEIEQLRPTTPPGMFDSVQQNGSLDDDAMDLSTSDDPILRTIDEDLRLLERTWDENNQAQQ